MHRLARLRRDESGMTYVFIGLGMMAFISASMLAIDVGMVMTSRNQAQNAADAGALAGATALLYDDFNNRAADGPAVTNAIQAATANQVMSGKVTVTPADVVFLNDEAGQPTRVRVTVHRSGVASDDNAGGVPTLIARYFTFAGKKMETVDISATATAEVSPANAMTCVKPFTIPDKWIENQTAPWDGDDTYDAFNNKGQPLADADIYIPATEPGYTGYNQERERGQKLVIRAATGSNITVSFYFSLAIGGLTGGDEYEWNIANCNTTIMHWGDTLIQEPGAMAGPTIHGADDLIARDPGASWDAFNKKVVGSAFPHSPRVFPIPLYDPPFYDSGKRNGRVADLKVANWIGFFLEETQGNGIWGRIIPIAGIRDANADNAPTGLNPKAIRLVQ